jgi:hypothetical protein
MATAMTVTSNYTGEWAGKILNAALLSGPTLANQLITILPNVKYKTNIGVYTDDAGIAAATCDFTDVGNLTLTERVLAPDDFQVNRQLCKKDYIPSFLAAEMGYGAFDNLPTSLSDYIIGLYSAKVAQSIEKAIWQGSGSTATEFTGFERLFLADATVPRAAVSASISATNVVAALASIMSAVSSSVYSQPDFGLYVSSNVARSYIAAQSTLGYQMNYNMWTQGKDQIMNTLQYQGVPMWVCTGLRDSCMVAASKSNLFFGTGLLNDTNEVRLIDQADIDGSQNVNLVMRFTAGIQFGIPADIAYYSVGV